MTGDEIEIGPGHLVFAVVIVVCFFVFAAFVVDRATDTAQFEGGCIALGGEVLNDGSHGQQKACAKDGVLIKVPTR